MLTLEILLVTNLFAMLSLLLFYPLVDTRYLRAMALFALLLLLLHFLVDKPNWPMTPFYLVSIVCPFIILLKVPRTFQIFTTLSVSTLLLCSLAVRVLVPPYPISDGFDALHEYAKDNIYTSSTIYSQNERSQNHIMRVWYDKTISEINRRVQYNDSRNVSFASMVSEMSPEQLSQLGPVLILPKTDNPLLLNNDPLFKKLMNSGYLIITFEPPQHEMTPVLACVK